jgi:hypothetical protein
MIATAATSAADDGFFKPANVAAQQQPLPGTNRSQGPSLRARPLK